MCVCVCLLFVCACSEINHEVKTDVNETESCGGIARAATVTIPVVWPPCVGTACVQKFVHNNCIELQRIRRRSVVIR